MAEIIPESISASTTATTGEKKLFRVFRDVLLPDEEYIVWYEPQIGTKNPDFVIWGQYLGLMIVEVKGWSLSQFVKVAPDKFHIRFQNGVQAVDSPLTQGQKVYRQLMDRIKVYKFLVHGEGDFKGQPKFPIGHCAIFTGFTRQQAQAADTEGGSIFDALPDGQCLFADDIDFDTDDEKARRTFTRKLKAGFKTSFQFDPLKHVDLKALRHALWPEVRIVSLRDEQPQSEEDMIRALDLDQERIAKSIGEGHRLLKGVVGSGKTLVLACRASYLAKVHPDWHILVVCYNIATAQYLRAMFKATTEEDALSRIKVSHFHGLVKELSGANLSKLRDNKTNDWESDESWDVRVGSFLRDAIETGKVAKGVFEAILIDEGQDFRTDWMQGLIQLLKPETNSLLFCYDAAQNVFGRATPNYKSAGFEIQGKKPVCLLKSYRTTQEILQFATRFAGITKDASADNRELGAMLFPESTERHGPLPLMKQILSIEALATYLATQVEKWLAEAGCTLADIGFLYSNFSYAKALAPSLKAKLGEGKVYWVTENQTTKGRFDISSPSVKLTSFESSKGLEFRKVVLIGLEDMPRSSRNAEEEKCIAYVALTRAQHELQILYMHETSMIKHCIEVLKQSNQTVRT